MEVTVHGDPPPGPGAGIVPAGYPGSDTALVSAGEVVAFGFMMDEAAKRVAEANVKLAAEQERAERAEAALAQVRALASRWVESGQRPPGERTGVVSATSAECGRQVLAIIDGEQS